MTPALLARVTDQEPVMVTICAWCSDARTRTAEAQAAGYLTSHTICQKCMAQLDAEDAR